MICRDAVWEAQWSRVTDLAFISSKNSYLGSLVPWSEPFAGLSSSDLFWGQSHNVGTPHIKLVLMSS